MALNVCACEALHKVKLTSEEFQRKVLERGGLS